MLFTHVWFPFTMLLLLLLTWLDGTIPDITAGGRSDVHALRHENTEDSFVYFMDDSRTDTSVCKNNVICVFFNVACSVLVTWYRPNGSGSFFFGLDQVFLPEHHCPLLVWKVVSLRPRNVMRFYPVLRNFWHLIMIISCLFSLFFYVKHFVLVAYIVLT